MADQMRPDDLPPAGWYPDPSGGSAPRWWSGTEWGPVGAVPASTPRRWWPLALLVGGVVIVAAMVAASNGAGGFISTIGLAAVVVGIVGLARRGVRALAIPGRAVAGAALAAGLVVLMVGGGVSAATRGPQAEAGNPRSFVDTGGETPAPEREPEITHEDVVVTEAIPFERTTVDDAGVAQGTTTVTTPGVEGVRTIVYRVTYTDGVETSRRQVSDEVTTAPVTEVTTVGTMPPRAAAPAPAPPAAAPGGCDPNYDPCVPIASDVDCAGGSGNGPAYVQGPARVIGRDVYGLDNDGDGTGCE